MEQLSRAEQLEQKRIYWKQHIDSWQETGLTQVEYCRQHDLKHHQLVYCGLLEKAIFKDHNRRILRTNQIRGFTGYTGSAGKRIPVSDNQ